MAMDLHIFHVTVYAGNESQTVEVWARNEWHARTRAMVYCTLKLAGQLVTYYVVPV